ncbi:helix-turn-helix domain-containing protein [Methylovorus glucosotrophus]|uniref:HTH cro/C1-type domain-containing protein n=1 Tax=Methylovorus glucosotrophus (strain SIP3-4) TaxID=582744 RepID=C6XEU0_METGS|nr:hypothetical protein Msip34_2831 [Methylovorus glucosotrophus SIP3-4]
MSTGYGKRIRLVREHLGLGRAEFCNETGIPKQSLINYETERTKANAEVLGAIANKWPEYAAYLLTDKTFVIQKNPEHDQINN